LLVVEVFVSKITDGGLTNRVADLSMPLIAEATKIVKLGERIVGARTVSEAQLTRTVNTMMDVVSAGLDRSLSDEAAARVKAEIAAGWREIARGVGR
jgi:hypothetical protein